MIPRSADLGAVLTDQEIEVEVYNAFRALSRVLTEITVEGPSGVTVEDPLGVPLVFPATRSVIYTVHVAALGNPTIDNTVTWVFVAVDPTGTVLLLTGFRTLPWSFDPNVADSIKQHYGYLTDVLEGDDGNEQRVQLREVPKGSIEMSLLLHEHEAQFANAILFGTTTRRFGLPLWPWRSQTVSDAALGATEVLFATADIPYVAGGFAFLWRTYEDWEVAEIAEVQGDRLVLAAPLRSAWPSGAAVMPFVSAYLGEGERFTWEALAIGSQRGRFDVPAFPVLAGVSGPLWQGYEVLEVEPNRKGPIDDEFYRRFVLLDTETGEREFDQLSPAPALIRPFLWTAFGRDEIAAMIAFIDRHKGRAVPFWVPSWQQDLRLTSDVILDQILCEIRRIRYAGTMFGSTGARRHLAVYSPQDAATYHKIVAATDPGSGLTETITVNPGAPRLWPAGATIVSFLRLCRLEDDEVEISWLAGNIAEAVVRIRELPNEAPV